MLFGRKTSGFHLSRRVKEVAYKNKSVFPECAESKPNFVIDFSNKKAAKLSPEPEFTEKKNPGYRPSTFQRFLSYFLLFRNAG